LVGVVYRGMEILVAVVVVGLVALVVLNVGLCKVEVENGLIAEEMLKTVVVEAEATAPVQNEFGHMVGAVVTARAGAGHVAEAAAAAQKDMLDAVSQNLIRGRSLFRKLLNHKHLSMLLMELIQLLLQKPKHNIVGLFV